MRSIVNKLSLGLSVAALAAMIPLHAYAHRMWLLPSATVFSGNDSWVTVDAAISNDLFYFERFPLRLEGLTVTGPDGAPVNVENAVTGHVRSVFDVQLTQPGTYRIAVVNHGLFASYTLNGQKKRWRGSADGLAAALPPEAKDVQITQSDSRAETFVTRGKPSDTASKITGQGLEMQAITVPTDLVSGTSSTFRFLLDGKPAGNIKVAVVPGGKRYSEHVEETALNTDADGVVHIRWPAPGMYWMEAAVQDKGMTVKQATSRRAAYAVTVEVAPL